MDLYSLTYNPTPSETIKLSFFYNPELIIEPFDFHIAEDGISQLQFGYDNDRENLYPGNISLTLIDYPRHNLHNFFNLYKHYNHAQPFNHWDTFYLEIIRNNITIFKGILDKIYDDWDNETLKLTFTDATTLFKNMSFKNPYVLYKLISKNYGRLNLQTHGYFKFLFFGIKTIAFDQNGNIADIIMDDDQFRDNYNLQDFLINILRIFNPYINFYINIPYQFSRFGYGLSGSFQNLFMGCTTIGSYKPHPIYSLIGRYIFFKGNLPFNIPNIKEHFEYIGKFSLSNGPDGSGIYTLYSYKLDNGIDDLSFASFFKKTANSFSARFGFIDFNNAFLIEKSSQLPEIFIEPFLREVNRESNYESYIHYKAKYFFDPDNFSETGEISVSDKSLELEVLFDTWDCLASQPSFEGNLFLRKMGETGFIYVPIDKVWNRSVGLNYNWKLSRTAVECHKNAAIGSSFIYNLSLNGFWHYLNYHPMLLNYLLNYNNHLTRLIPTEINYDIFKDIIYIRAISSPQYY